MVGKLCAAPRGGGSAGGLVEYLVGYSISEKGATREEIADALDAVYAEAEERADLGVDVIWSPEAGGGTRPSSVLVRNCASFSTAAMEMDADAVSNPGIRTSAMHFVWSWDACESAHLTDSQVHGYVGEVMQKLGLEHHRSVSVVHRDTDHVHVHGAVGSVDPSTGLAYDRTGLFRRMAWAEREVELAHGLSHDHGLAVVRDAGTPKARVDWADKHELAAWRSERREERIARLERRSYEGYRERDTTFARYADATVAPRLRATMDTAVARGREASWADMHAVAARYGCALLRGADGAIVLRDVGLGEMRLRHERERRSESELLNAQGVDRDEADQQIAALRSQHERVEVAERERKVVSGESIPLDSLDVDVAGLDAFRDATESEAEVIGAIERDPGIVLADVTAQSSTFTREDVEFWLASRISDPSEIERLGDLVISGGDVRVLSADTMQPLMTTTEVVAIEYQLADDAAALARTSSGISAVDVDRAVAAYEAHASVGRATPFRLTGEQGSALQSLTRGSLAAVEGLPGTGKTTIMGAVRLIGEQTGREVVGLTLSQAAAERLESEAGFRCVNTARAAIMETRGKAVIPRDGIVVVDEAAMVDSRTQARILALARERHCTVVEVGDTRQLQPIDFGASFRIVRDAARETGTYSEMRDIQRQRNGWHRDAVVTLADAITERDESKRVSMVRKALGALEQHGAIVWTADRNRSIDAASDIARELRAKGADTIVVASDKDTVRHLAEQGRGLDGLAGTGRSYRTDCGVKEFAPGDKLMFRKNSLGRGGLGVRNGERGEVLAVARGRIDVRMSDGRVVPVHTRRYHAIDHGGASTVHVAQGASVDSTVAVIDRSASAELAFVAASRSRNGLKLVVPRTAFRDLDDLSAHVASRISLKTTTRTYDELLDRTGGKDTIRVQNIEAQRAAEPLRRVYCAEVTEPARAARDAIVAAARAMYKARLAAIAADPSISLADRIIAKDEALRAFRAGSMSAHHATRPAPFGAWLAERDQARDRVRTTQDLRAKTRDVTRDRNHAERNTNNKETMSMTYEEAKKQKQARGAMPAFPARAREAAATPAVRSTTPRPTPGMDQLNSKGVSAAGVTEQAKFTASQTRGPQSARPANQPTATPAKAAAPTKAPAPAKAAAPAQAAAPARAPQSRGEAAKASAQSTAAAAKTRAAEPAKSQSKGISR